VTKLGSCAHQCTPSEEGKGGGRRKPAYPYISLHIHYLVLTRKRAYNNNTQIKMKSKLIFVFHVNKERRSVRKTERQETGREEERG
jgi:hypothetical protein